MNGSIGMSGVMVGSQGETDAPGWTNAGTYNRAHSAVGPARVCAGGAATPALARPLYFVAGLTGVGAYLRH